MATPNVVPRSDGQGNLGTGIVLGSGGKKWLKMYTTTGFQVGINDAAHTIQMTNIDSAGATQGNILWEGSIANGYETSLVAINATADRILSLPDLTCTLACISGVGSPTQAVIVACSDETSLLTTGTAKVTFRMPYAFTLTNVRANVNTAPTGAVLTVDINDDGSTMLSTKLTIDIGEETSVTAAAAHAFASTAIADDSEMTIDIDTVGSTIAGKGLKVELIGYIT